MRRYNVLKVSLAVVASLLVGIVSVHAWADDGKCPKGKVYNPDTKKCVTPRGSN
jgi:hypothetical protein